MKTISGLIAALLLTSTLLLAFGIQQAECLEPPTIEWTRTYGGIRLDAGRCVIQTDDGGYLLGGNTESFGAGGRDFWLVKTDADGNEQWNRTYGGPRDEYLESLIKTRDGCYAMAGRTWSFGAGDADFWLVKINSDGSELWNRSYGGTDRDYAYSLVETLDGGYAIAGDTSSYGAGVYDMLLVKTDAAGYEEWNETYGGHQDETAYYLIQGTDGGYLLIGNTWSFGSGLDDIWLVKTDSNGSGLWNKTYGGANYEYAYSASKTANGGYVIAGTTHSYGSGWADVWLLEIDSCGNMVWNGTYGGTGYDEPLCIIQTSDEGYAVIGDTNSFGAGIFDFWWIKINADHEVQWSATYGGESYDYGRSLVQTNDNGYVLAGRTDSFGAGDGDFWLIKLAPREISATVDINPDTLNSKSKGKWITAYIELPQGYDVANINVSSILLNSTIPAEPEPTAIGDYDSDGIPDLMVKFDRAEVIEYILDHVHMTQKFTNIELTVTGYLNDGTPFQGIDTIKIISNSKYEKLPT